MSDARPHPDTAAPGDPLPDPLDALFIGAALDGHAEPVRPVRPAPEPTPGDPR